ncbi:Ionotropic glutamate receptor [Parasponia andersonii]|uniref:Glutamate receptor n=1 Tax=Parasponia andersonii TaxID=3476 RepID=A0A2P5D657_PARAD|nr:Ionotropic glutamate receptor [Parasponia andersonii]
MRLLFISLCWVLLFSGVVICQRPTSVNIGAIFTFNSVIGRVAKPAIEAAVSDINADPSILNGTKLELITEDSNCSAFLGSIEVFQVLEDKVLAIIGPQSSAIGHILSEIANGLQVPLLSYAATDPTLSALQFPFFFRTTHSDAYQMAAMADLVDFYEWKQVITVFVDNEYGRNGISALEDELEKKLVKIAYKLALPVYFDVNNITELLNSSKLFGPRVYVVHVDTDPSLKIFKVAESLNMMTSNYVWLATDWLSSTIDSFSPMARTSLGSIHGVVSLRPHTLESSRKRVFLSRWKKKQQTGSANSELNVYGLYAYDTVWAVAYAIDSFILEHGNISFSFDDKLRGIKTTEIQLSKLRVFDGGPILRSKLLETNFAGLTGPVRFNSDRNIISSGYDIINIDKMEIRRVGFWSKVTGFSVSPPETLKVKQNSYSQLDQKLNNVTWPGGETETPRGWVIAVNEKPLRIVVPNRTSFIEFVTEYDHHDVRGYCIDIFIEAQKLIPYDVPYRFEPFGDGHSNPKYDQLVKMVADDVFDAAVGDIAIVKNRTEIVDFSQPYASTGLVIVAPISRPQSNAWVFLKPFTWELWCVTVASFLMIAIIIWTLEHRVNDDFRGPPKRQLVTMFLFSFSTLFKRNQEDTVSPLGRMVMVVWLFLLMVITSSYTASLTSILTVQQLFSPITGIDSLIATNSPIGYQVGSFVYNYLTEILYIPSTRLVSLRSPEEYERALRQGPSNGGVAAIIDELPYVELFLSEQTDFGIIGQAFTRNGWGFAFQRESPLAVDISTAILKLSESGKLQEIHKRWFCKMECPGEKGENYEPNQLRLSSFWGLYLLCGAISLFALLIFLLRMVRQFVRYKRWEKNLTSPLSSRSSSSQWSDVIYSFFDFVDEREEAVKKMLSQSNKPQDQTGDQ